MKSFNSSRRSLIGLVACALLLSFICITIFTQHHYTSPSYTTDKVNNKEPERNEHLFFELDDNLLFGKSCLRSSGAWDCRDCGLQQANQTIFTTRNDCPELVRNNICKPFHQVDWDGTAPRQSTSLSAATASTSHNHILYHYAMDLPVYEQIQCDSIEDCFNMTKCPRNESMKLYAHGHAGSLAQILVAHAAKLYPNLLEQTESPIDACLLIVTCDSYDNTSQLASHFYHQGRNHFVWEATHCFGAHPDRPYDHMFNYQRAALATGALSDSNVRRGYDVPLTRVQSMTSLEVGRADSSLFKTLILPPDDEDTSERPFLLSFKGNIYNWQQVWWGHRWVATEYWSTTDPEIVVDTKCIGKEHYTQPESTFGALLMNSTFGFAPGGGGVGSYRFGEVLGLGGIPVVLSDFLPPMWPDMDWSGCLVRVSEARVVDLPRILRNISKEEIRQRSRRCKVLFRHTIGWRQFKKDKIPMWEIDSGERAFLTSMKVWYSRIQDYYSQQSRKSSLEAMR